MDNNDFTPKGHARSNWCLLGRSELSIDETFPRSSCSWLLHILAPISLPKDFADKIKLSLDETISQYLTSSRVEVRIFISQDVQVDHSMNQNWGYFKLEKIGCDTDAGHIIEYYIYFEK